MMMTHTEKTNLNISIEIENRLVARNLRGMKTMQPALQPGYILRAAELLISVRGTVLIGTGFPVDNTFETDGPVGAIALYQACEALGATPILVCDLPLCNALKNNFRVHEIKRDIANHKQQAIDDLMHLSPQLIISIERPGQAQDGHYYNMRGIHIGSHTACFDDYLKHASCPTIGIGDGGNEIGMGNIYQALQALDIQASTTQCNELVIADVSNWGALGIIAMLEYLSDEPLIKQLDIRGTFAFLSQCGSVDGVTKINALTEDGLPMQEGLALLQTLQSIINHKPSCE